VFSKTQTSHTKLITLDEVEKQKSKIKCLFESYSNEIHKFNDYYEELYIEKYLHKEIEPNKNLIIKTQLAQ
jgi:archaellum component FlaC